MWKFVMAIVVISQGNVSVYLDIKDGLTGIVTLML